MKEASGDGRYRFCCHLQREPIMQGSLFLLQIVLVLSDVVLVFVIANVFAAKAYKPLQILTESIIERFRIRRRDMKTRWRSSTI